MSNIVFDLAVSSCLCLLLYLLTLQDAPSIIQDDRTLPNIHGRENSSFGTSRVIGTLRAHPAPPPVPRPTSPLLTSRLRAADLSESIQRRTANESQYNQSLLTMRPSLHTGRLYNTQLSFQDRNPLSTSNVYNPSVTPTLSMDRSALTNPRQLPSEESHRRVGLESATGSRYLATSPRQPYLNSTVSKPHTTRTLASSRQSVSFVDENRDHSLSISSTSRRFETLGGKPGGTGDMSGLSESRVASDAKYHVDNTMDDEQIMRKYRAYILRVRSYAAQSGSAAVTDQGTIPGNFDKETFENFKRVRRSFDKWILAVKTLKEERALEEEINEIKLQGARVILRQKALYRAFHNLKDACRAQRMERGKLIVALEHWSSNLLRKVIREWGRVVQLMYPEPLANPNMIRCLFRWIAATLPDRGEWWKEGDVAGAIASGSAAWLEMERRKDPPLSKRSLHAIQNRAQNRTLQELDLNKTLEKSIRHASIDTTERLDNSYEQILNERKFLPLQDASFRRGSTQSSIEDDMDSESSSLVQVESGSLVVLGNSLVPTVGSLLDRQDQEFQLQHWQNQAEIRRYDSLRSSVLRRIAPLRGRIPLLEEATAVLDADILARIWIGWVEWSKRKIEMRKKARNVILRRTLRIWIGEVDLSKRIHHLQSARERKLKHNAVMALVANVLRERGNRQMQETAQQFADISRKLRAVRMWRMVTAQGHIRRVREFVQRWHRFTQLRLKSEQMRKRALKRRRLEWFQHWRKIHHRIQEFREERLILASKLQKKRWLQTWKTSHAESKRLMARITEFFQWKLRRALMRWRVQHKYFTRLRKLSDKINVHTRKELLTKTFAAWKQYSRQIAEGKVIVEERVYNRRQGLLGLIFRAWKEHSRGKRADRRDYEENYEALVKFKLRKTLKLWKTNKSESIRLRRAEQKLAARREKRLLSKVFRTYRMYVREQKANRSQMDHADKYYDDRRIRNSLVLWRNFTQERIFRQKQKVIAVRKYHHSLYQKCLRLWFLYMQEREIVNAKARHYCRKIQRKYLLRPTLYRLKAYVEFKKKQRAALERALYIRNVRLRARHAFIAWLDRMHDSINNEKADKLYKKILMRQLFNTIKRFAEEKRERNRDARSASALFVVHKLKKAVYSWRVAAFQAQGVRQLREKRFERQIRTYIGRWFMQIRQKKMMENAMVELSMRLVQASNRACVERVFQAWADYTLRRRELRKAEYAIANLRATHLAKRAFHPWHAVAQRHRALYLMEYFARQITLGRPFSIWKQRFMVDKIEDMSVVSVGRSLGLSYWFRDIKYPLPRSIGNSVIGFGMDPTDQDTETEDVVGIFPHETTRSSNLFRTIQRWRNVPLAAAFSAWKEYFRTRKDRNEKIRSFRDHAEKKRIGDAVERWRSYAANIRKNARLKRMVRKQKLRRFIDIWYQFSQNRMHARNERERLKRLADQHYSHRLLQKGVLALWKHRKQRIAEQLAWEEEKIAEWEQIKHQKVIGNVRDSLQHWREYTNARNQWRDRYARLRSAVCRRMIRDSLRKWRTWNKAKHQEKLESLQAADHMDLVKAQLALGRWRKYRAESAKRRKLVDRAYLHYNNTLVRKAFEGLYKNMVRQQALRRALLIFDRHASRVAQSELTRGIKLWREGCNFLAICDEADLYYLRHVARKSLYKLRLYKVEKRAWKQKIAILNRALLLWKGRNALLRLKAYSRSKQDSRLAMEFRAKKEVLSMLPRAFQAWKQYVQRSKIQKERIVLFQRQQAWKKILEWRTQALAKRSADSKLQRARAAIERGKKQRILWAWAHYTTAAAIHRAEVQETEKLRLALSRRLERTRIKTLASVFYFWRRRVAVTKYCRALSKSFQRKLKLKKCFEAWKLYATNRARIRFERDIAYSRDRLAEVKSNFERLHDELQLDVESLRNPEIATAVQTEGQEPMIVSRLPRTAPTGVLLEEAYAGWEAATGLQRDMEVEATIVARKHYNFRLLRRHFRAWVQFWQTQQEKPSKFSITEHARTASLTNTAVEIPTVEQPRVHKSPESEFCSSIAQADTYSDDFEEQDESNYDEFY